MDVIGIIILGKYYLDDGEHVICSSWAPLPEGDIFFGNSHLFSLSETRTLSLPQPTDSRNSSVGEEEGGNISVLLVLLAL